MSQEPGGEQPLILLSNDDSIDAPALHALEAAMSALGEVWVVAPLSEQSGVSSALSLHDPLRIHKRGERRFAVSGTPADCVYMALHQILPRRPALCVSGINQGANLGDDVIYSGTVAAAIEATLHDVPAMAISHTSGGRKHDFEPVGRVAVRVAAELMRRHIPRGTLLNVNVPRGVAEDAPIVITKLGRRNYERRVSEQRDPRGAPYYWIGGSEVDFDDLPGSDCNAIAAGHISITPLHIDLTHYRTIEALRQWFA